MGDGDRPGGPGRDGGGKPAKASLRVYRGAGARRATRIPSGPGEVAARLAALERRIEEALAETGFRQPPTPDVIRQVVDTAFSTIASARRWSVAEFVASLRDTADGLATADVAAVVDAVLHGVYRYWWRVDAVGLERVPAAGPVIFAANRSGALVPWEALMLGVGLAEQGARTDAHLLVDDWTSSGSVLASALARTGVERAGGPAMRRVLGRAEAAVVFPEGRQALAKAYRRRYRLASFGPGTFAKVAMETGAAILPVAVIGAEEIHPVLGRIDWLGSPLGLPTVPLTTTFPWLGVAGLLPLPTKWTVVVGEPLDVASRFAARDASKTEVVRGLRDQVRERLQALVTETRRRRPAIFRA